MVLDMAPGDGRRILATALLITALLAAAPAWAYIGPGAGLSAIGSIVALFAAVGLAIVGFVWYPVKRLRRRRAEKNRKDDSPAEKAAG
jgi:hypothetical protein